MKLMHPLFSEPILFPENKIQVLVLENPLMFRRLTTEIVQQSEGYSGEFVLSQNDTCLDCADHINVFFDFLHHQEMEKRLQTKLIAALLKNTQEMLAKENFDLAQSIQAYLGKLATIADFPVSYEQTENLSALLKAMDFRVDFNGLSACEAMYEHIAVLNGLLKAQCFVLIHAHDYFSSEELISLYNMAHYRKIPLLLLESHLHEALEMEEIRLFDKDMCELILEERQE